MSDAECRPRASTRTVAFVTAALLAGPAALATVVENLTVSAAVELSDVVVAGCVVRTEARQVARGRIDTFVWIEVDEVLSGTLPRSFIRDAELEARPESPTAACSRTRTYQSDTACDWQISIPQRVGSEKQVFPVSLVVVRSPGGQVGDRKSSVEAAPRFAVGECVLLFLARSADGSSYRTVGLFLGAYQLTQHAGGLVAVQHRDDGALRVPAHVDGALPARVDYRQLVDAIDAAAAGLGR